jgi:hypothetical protein
MMEASMLGLSTAETLVQQPAFAVRRADASQKRHYGRDGDNVLVIKARRNVQHRTLG